MLTDQEKMYLAAAIDTAIKNTQDSIAAASVLLPLMHKILEQTDRQTEGEQWNQVKT